MSLRMNFRRSVLLMLLFFLLTACGSKPQKPEQPIRAIPAGQYQYQVGLGYGFLGKQVQVSVDGQEVLSIVGNEEIENFAQLLGTKMLTGGSSDSPVIIVRVVLDGGPAFEQVVDLGEGGFIHIYNQETGLQVFNTSELVLE